MYAWLLSTFTDGKKSIKTRSREEGKKQEARVECGAQNQEKVGGRDQQGGTPGEAQCPVSTVTQLCGLRKITFPLWPTTS